MGCTCCADGDPDALARAIARELRKLQEQEPKVVLKLGASEIRSSLLELKRRNGGDLGLS